MAYQHISAGQPVASSSSGGRLSGAERRHLEGIFRGVRHTLLNRGLCRHRKDGGLQEVAWKRTILLSDLGIVAFEVDVQRLPVKIEQLLNPEVAHQMQASLGGRRVKVTNSRGLFFGVRLEPDPPRPKVRLPRHASFDPSTMLRACTEQAEVTGPSILRKSLGQAESTYLVPIGQGADGPVWCSLLDTGHILVGGESGSGKSTWLNTALIALLAAHTPQELQVAIVDPKEVEFQAYRGLPHLFAPPAAEIDDAAALTARLMAEMDRRRALFSHVGAKNLLRYNQRVADPSTQLRACTELEGSRISRLPLICLIIDEVTDIALAAGLKSPFYTNLIRLSSKGRAFGLVMVLATQNPKAEVLNTLIRGNMSTRIAFRVASAEQSRVILGFGGAQKLPRTIRGRLMARLDRGLETLQGLYITEEDVERLVGELRGRRPPVLTELEEELVRHAVEHLGGKFHIHNLAAAFKGRIGMKRIWRLAKNWELRGWLIPGPSRADGRRVSDELLGLLSPSPRG
ncbi:MAG: DNA translocase FtsK [Anaerolineae bacterium]|nr:MAG: DNA translocase FtsK [Anaerolineae bacterium]